MSTQTSVCRDCGELIWFDGAQWLRLVDNSPNCITTFGHGPKSK